MTEEVKEYLRFAWDDLEKEEATPEELMTRTVAALNSMERTMLDTAANDHGGIDDMAIPLIIVACEVLAQQLRAAVPGAAELTEGLKEAVASEMVIIPMKRRKGGKNGNEGL